LRADSGPDPCAATGGRTLAAGRPAGRRSRAIGSVQGGSQDPDRTARRRALGHDARNRRTIGGDHRPDEGEGPRALSQGSRLPEPAAGKAYLRVSSSSTSNTSEAPGGITRPAPSAP